MNTEFEVMEIIEGHCPHCGQPYGYLKEVNSGMALNEFSKCLCQRKPVYEEEVAGMHQKSFAGYQKKRSDVA